MIKKMNCPKCNKIMTRKCKDVSHDSKTKAEYARGIYACKADDVWVTVEIPNVPKASKKIAKAKRKIK